MRPGAAACAPPPARVRPRRASATLRCAMMSRSVAPRPPHDAAPAVRAGRAVIRPAADLPRVFLSRRTRRRPFRRTADGRTPA